jgi:hypothetical protein
LNKYANDAKYSLLFLDEISSISFLERTILEPRVMWEVSSTRVGVPGTSSIHEVTIREKTGPSGGEATDPTKWWIITGFTGEQGIPEDLVDMATQNRLEAKYGLAASLGSPKNSLFMGLPLQGSADLGLPVSVNAVSLSLLISLGSHAGILTEIPSKKAHGVA